MEYLSEKQLAQANEQAKLLGLTKPLTNADVYETRVRGSKVMVCLTSAHWVLVDAEIAPTPIAEPVDEQSAEQPTTRNRRGR